MKTARDPRHKKRRILVKELFAQSFTKQKKLSGQTIRVLSKIHMLDKKIGNAAPTCPIDKLNKIDLAILRLAVFELSNKSTPPKVVIDEAVELAKEFGSEASPSFINGVLGTIFKQGKKGYSKKPTKQESIKID